MRTLQEIESEVLFFLDNKADELGETIDSLTNKGRLYVKTNSIAETKDYILDNQLILRWFINKEFDDAIHY